MYTHNIQTKFLIQDLKEERETQWWHRRRQMVPQFIYTELEHKNITHALVPQQVT